MSWNMACHECGADVPIFEPECPYCHTDLSDDHTAVLGAAIGAVTVGAVGAWVGGLVGWVIGVAIGGTAAAIAAYKL